MEAYITPEIEFADFEEDVIMASQGSSGTSNTPNISPYDPTLPINSTNSTGGYGLSNLTNITIPNGATGGDTPIDEPIPVHTPIGPASLWYLPF